MARLYDMHTITKEQDKIVSRALISGGHTFLYLRILIVLAVVLWIDPRKLNVSFFVR
jgi:hypothetical protein